MPNNLDDRFRQGNRSEYLAQYFLSALGVAAPVIRQEDIGVDFYCALAKKTGRNLTFHSHYIVQLGTKTKKFSYGGKDKKTGRWRKEGVEWLFSQEVPLFMCVIDRHKAEFKMYSTSPMWITRYLHGTPGKVLLIPDAKHDPKREVRGKKITLPRNFGDRYTHHVPMFAPIVKLSLRDLENLQMIEKAKHALKVAIEEEQKNIRYRSLNVHFSKWLIDVVPNEITRPPKLAESYAYNDSVGMNTNEQLEGMLPICIALALNLNAQKRYKELKKLLPIFSLMPESKFPTFLKKMLVEFRKRKVADRPLGSVFV